MKKPRIRFALAAALVLFACFLLAHLPAPVQGQANVSQKIAPKPKPAPAQKAAPLQGPVGQFKIGEFTVIVDTGKPSDDRGLATANSRNIIAQPAVQTAEGLSGSGHILIKGQRTPVTFSGIKFAQSAPGQVPVATSGTVKGTPGAAVEYALNGVKIKIERQTIQVTPSSATAAVGVSLAQAPFMAAGTANALTLASESCTLFPDGGVAGKNFRGPSSFLLRDSLYRLRLDPQANQSVLLGQQKAGPRQTRALSGGIELNGIASTSDNNVDYDVFNFNGTIGDDGKSARFDLTLIRTPYQTVPEPGYVLFLKSGFVNYNYGQDGALNCSGEFNNAQVTLPETVMGQNPGRIVLDNIVLKTDETGALFNALTIATPFRAGFSDVNQPGQALFLIEPAPDAAFIYFPKWQAPQNSSYTMTVTDRKKGPDCKALVDFLEHGATSGTSGRVAVPRRQVQQKALAPARKSQAHQQPAMAAASAKPTAAAAQVPAFRQNDEAKEKNIYGRPGLTILQGTLHMKSPQASSPGMGTPLAGEFQLKTQVWGLLTATPWGLTGSLTSSACSFVLDSPDHSLAECSRPSGTSRPTWTEILRAQESDPKGLPPVKKERFRLSDLRVLEMRLTSLDLCMNGFADKGVTMSSIVHFPFPSYIDVDFVDQSLDAQGFFHTALGPVAPVAKPIAVSAAPESAPDDPDPDPVTSSGTPHGPSNATESTPLRSGQQAHLGPLVKPNLPQPIPQTYILWAWRLPITLTDRGVMITFPQGRGPASVRVLMSSTPDEKGNFTSSEIWLKPLFSKRSTVKQGVRVEAALVSTGGFLPTRWDPDPILCRTSPSQGTVQDGELKMGFACRIDAITLAETAPIFNAEDRDSDFGWKGKVTLPLFKDQLVTFGVKKLEPSMPQTLNLQQSGCAGQSCPVLDITIRDLAFSPYQYHFASTDVRYRYPASADNAEYAAVSVEFSSFLNAFVIKKADTTKPWLELTDILAPGQSLTRHGLKDYRDSDGLIDLTCYDPQALNLENGLGLPVGCCLNNFKMGTYQVKQGENVILSASNVRYYENRTPVKLYLGGTAMELTPEGDGGAGGNKELLDVPGAELKYENGALFGDFDTDSLPAFLPNIRGECAFTLDTRNAYFSLMIGGSFPITPFPVNVEGASFFFHAPRNQLDPIIDKAAGWALYANAASMKTAVGMSDRDIRGTTVLSGALLSGDAAVKAKFGPVEAMVQRGAGLFFYQYKNEGGPTGYNYGVFMNTRGEADVKFLKAEIVFDLTLAADSEPPASGHGSFSSVKQYFQRTDLAFTGTISASVCATCELAYARLDMLLTARYSVREGLTWTDVQPPTPSVGLGGCR
jgi:hypothetical protein